MEVFDIEKALIGAVLSEPNLLGDALSVPVDLFQAKGHKVLWQGVLSLLQKGKSIDPVLLAEEIGAKEMVAIDGESLILSCFDSASIESFSEYLEALKTRKHRRDFKLDLQKSLAVVEDDLDKARDIAQSGLIALSGLGEKAGFASSGELIADLLEDMFRLKENPDLRNELYLPTGFADYDKSYGGLPQGLTILAGRPGMGKSAFALSLSLNVLRSGRDVLFFSLEMSSKQLMVRLTSTISGIDSRRLEVGDIKDMETESLMRAGSELADLPLHINEHATALREIKSQIEQWRVINGRNPGLVVIDYLGLVQVPEYRGEAAKRAAVGKVCNELAVYFTKQVQSPLLMLAQLNRGVESQQDKRPNLSDLRDSGEIEQAAARVDFLYRDAYYNPDTPKQSCTELLTKKNRFGACGMVELFFEPQTTSFHNYGGIGGEY